MQTGSVQLLSQNVTVSAPKTYKNASAWIKSAQAVNTKVLGTNIQFPTTLKSKNSAEEKQFLSPWKQQ